MTFRTWQLVWWSVAWFVLGVSTLGIAVLFAQQPQPLVPVDLAGQWFVIQRDDGGQLYAPNEGIAAIWTLPDNEAQTLGFRTAVYIKGKADPFYFREMLKDIQVKLVPVKDLADIQSE